MQRSGSSEGCKLSSNKPTSPQAGSRKRRGHKLRVQASILSQQAQGSGSPNKVGSAQAPGSRQQAHRNFWDA